MCLPFRRHCKSASHARRALEAAKGQPIQLVQNIMNTVAAAKPGSSSESEEEQEEEDGSAFESGPLPPPPEVPPPLPEMEQPALHLVSTLRFFQARKQREDPTKARMRRRYVTGMREALKWVRLGKCRLLLVARDIELAPGEGGTEEVLLRVLDEAAKRAVPTCWVLSRARLGGIFGEG